MARWIIQCRGCSLGPALAPEAPMGGAGRVQVVSEKRDEWGISRSFRKRPQVRLGTQDSTTPFPTLSDGDAMAQGRMSVELKARLSQWSSIYGSSEQSPRVSISCLHPPSTTSLVAKDLLLKAQWQLTASTGKTAPSGFRSRRSCPREKCVLSAWAPALLV